jgi:hypothetical protein
MASPQGEQAKVNLINRFDKQNLIEYNQHYQTNKGETK